MVKWQMKQEEWRPKQEATKCPGASRPQFTILDNQAWIAKSPKTLSEVKTKRETCSLSDILDEFGIEILKNEFTSRVGTSLSRPTNSMWSHKLSFHFWATSTLCSSTTTSLFLAFHEVTGPSLLPYARLQLPSESRNLENILRSKCKVSSISPYSLGLHPFLRRRTGTRKGSECLYNLHWTCYMHSRSCTVGPSL